MTYQADTYANTALGQSWLRARGMVSDLAELFTAARKNENGQPSLMRGVRREALAQLRRAEAMVRRMLIMIAASLPRPKVYAYSATAGEPCARPEAERRPNREPQPLKHFRLAEPEQPAVRAMRGGRLADYAPPPVALRDMGAEPADASDLLPAVHLFERIDALSAALADPARHAARMARWIERRRRYAEDRLARRYPLRLGGPPGWSRYWTRRNDTVSALGDLDLFAREALEAWDTS